MRIAIPPKRLLKGGAAALAAVAGLVLLRTVRGKQLRSHPSPAPNHDEALRRAGKLQALDNRIARPECQGRLFTHGKTTDRVFLLFHGYTNCPSQFRQLGMRLFESGHNVFIPRMPHHGFPDRMTESHAKLTAQELAVHADSAVDIARGLGRQVTIAGISAGGTLAGWVAEARPDIQRAVLISPVFGFGGYPVPITRIIMHLLLAVPNYFQWWDERLKGTAPIPRHVYPRYSSRALGEILRVGFSLRRQLRNRKSTSSTTIVVATNGNDTAVNNKATAVVTRLWQRTRPDKVQTYHFDASMGLPHDLVDPDHEQQQIARVYPALTELITRES